MRYESIPDLQQTVTSEEYSNSLAYLHFHRSIELIYVKRGCLLVHIGTKDITVGENEIAFVPSYFPHSVQPLEQSLSETFLVPHNHFTFLENNSVNLNFLKLDKAEINRKILEYMLLTKAELADNHTFLIHGYVNVIFGLILKHYQNERNENTAYNLVEEIIAYIEQHYTENLTLSIMAEHFHYSKCYFSKIFNKLFGCSIRAYINNVRINHITSEQSKKSITQKVFDAGFQDLSTYYKSKSNMQKY